MTGQALFVDLPNFYSRLLKSGIDDPRLLRDYFLTWLDFDRLAKELTGDTWPVWIFYSGRRIGPSGNRITDEILDEYIGRINRLTGVTAYDVNIPGRQREPATYQCEECGHKGVAQWESEKGIDSSLTTHLFDTMDTWDIAYLVSGDADFVPAVASLRRRGKLVVGAGFSDASSALVRECFAYVNLGDTFLLEDLVAYKLFRSGGLVERWLTDDVMPIVNKGIVLSPVELRVSCFPHGAISHRRKRYPCRVSERVGDEEYWYYVEFTAKGPVDLTERMQLFEQMLERFNGPSQNNDNARISSKAVMSASMWAALRPRIDGLLCSLRGLAGLSRVDDYVIKYRYSETNKKYEPVEG